MANGASSAWAASRAFPWLWRAREPRSTRLDARDGKHPRNERLKAQRAIPSFATAARRVHAAHSPAFKNNKHRAQWITTLETYAFPVLGDRRIDTIESGDVMQVLGPVWLEKPETARRVKQRLKAVFDWAKANGHYTQTNPTEGITKALPAHKGDKKHHAALPYPQVPAFVTALRTLSDVRASVRLGLEFLILTATRTNEVQLARWEEINRDTRTWTIPGVRMKSGREHQVPLCARALEILDEAERLRRTDNTFLFPGQKAGQSLSNMTFLKTARRVTTVPLTTHGFRSSFRDWAAERTNAPGDVCDAALAHTVKDKVEAAYKRTKFFEQRRDLMDRWAHFATSTPATVIAIQA